MYLHDFQCPNCERYYNRKWYDPRPGKLWCQLCEVECQHDETFIIQDAHMSRYDRQLIVQFNNTLSYKEVQQAGTGLNNRARRIGLPSEIVEFSAVASTVDESIKAKFRALTERSRLYLVGHGAGATLQGALALNLAYAVKFEWGLKAAARIVLVSCSIGESVQTPFGENYSKEFHLYLLRQNRLATEVAAYQLPITITPGEYADKLRRPELEGTKVFKTPDDQYRFMKQDEDKVKIVWYWEHNTQRFRRRSADRAR